MSTGKKLDVIGHPRRRIDSREKVTGQLRYADDMKLPRMLHMKLLRSSHPHALIESIDIARAQGYPGVHLVLTGKDFPVPFGIMPVAQDEYPLAPEHVRYVGDPVAAVVATDEQTACAALQLIEVKYKSLPTIATPEEALAQPEARIHDYTDVGNIHRNQAFEFGDVEEALAKSDHVFEDLFFYEGDNHMAMEQHAALAKAEGDGKLTLWSSTQDPHYLHRQLARVLQMSAAHIRVIACDNGGGFGGKCDPAGHEFVVSKAALMLGRPVKICLTREEVFYLHRGRHPVLMKFRTGVTKEGKLTGMHLQTLLDGGAYGSHGPASTFYTGVLTPLTYELPRFKFDACRVFTNKPACGPKRGHGTPQPRFGQEIQLDKIAEKLKLDPADLRLNMVTKPNSLTASWLKIGSNGLAECIRQVVDGSGWKQKHGKLPKGRGVGIACGSYMCGAGVSIYWNKMPHSGVQLTLDRSGQVTVFCGATEIGQGSDDVLAAIVAETLGITTKEVRCITGDTGITPIDLGSYSSRVTLMMGNAALQAAGRARDMLVTAAAEQLAVLPESIVLSRGRVFAAGDANKSMSFAEAVVYAETKYGTLGTVGSYTPPKPPGKFKAAGVGPSPAYSFSACVVEVEVDEHTGWITVPKIWMAHDIGRALNPVLTRGQVIGGIYMGLGEALMEEQVFRRLPPKLSNALVHKIPSLLEYKSITSLDMPEVEVYLIEDPDPNCPFGAKEVGQGPLLPVMPAVANAVFDAVGVRIDEVPITPEKILRALHLKREGKNPRVGPDHFPDVPYVEPTFVLPPGEGGDGNESKMAIKKSVNELLEKSGIMMRLPWFQYKAPTSVAEAARILAGEGPRGMLIAGGTDLLPNMKRRQQTPATLISLSRVDGLKKIANGSGLTLGAGLTLSEVVGTAAVREKYRGLWQAAAQVASPHLRNMGTLGGNLCLDTRCNYYNQNEEWREAIGYCMKKEGSTCWVATASKRCLAVSSTDTAPALIALGAKVRLVSAAGERELALASLYNNDGINYITRRPDEILTEVVLPEAEGWRSAYWKLRRRGSFDFPLLGVAAAARAAPDGTILEARLVLGAVSSQPIVASKASEFLAGKKLTDEVIAEAGALAASRAKPMDNTDLDVYWRKEVVPDFVGYALREIRGDDMSAMRMRISRQAL